MSRSLVFKPSDVVFIMLINVNINFCNRENGRKFNSQLVGILFQFHLMGELFLSNLVGELVQSHVPITLVGELFQL